MVDVAVIGAGPYGLSLGAHLKACGVDFRIFGSPMHTWLNQMPRGMKLKSEGFASSLDDPDTAYTLAEYCRGKGIPYQDMGLPVPLETFTNYGLEFQKKFVPQLEDQSVVGLNRISGGFKLDLASGESLSAKKVVSSIGISYFAYVPPMLAALPEDLSTHSSQHVTMDRFKGKEVVVVGAGSSAVDLAALLHEAGVLVRLVARKPAIRFHSPMQLPRPLMDRVRNPMTGLGPGWRARFCTDAPLAFRQLPQGYRLRMVRSYLGPAPGWFVKDQVVGKVPFHLGMNITQAGVQNSRVRLELTDHSGVRQPMEADHVIAATGYRVDLRKLAFLNSDLLAGIQSVEQTPVLSSNFESSVPGLYFMGASAANTFGPLLRFAFGARFAARRLSRHLAGNGSGSRNVRR
jgi:cation diffusion facilitator CzcD-associated flavoprotein CzcO